MNGGHESLGDAEGVVDDLGERCEAVGGARGVRDDRPDVLVVLGVVHPHDVHRRGVLTRGADDDLLAPALDVSARLFGGGEDPAGERGRERWRSE